MIIWSGWGLLIAVIVGVGMALSGYAAGQGWISDTPYTMTIGMALSAIAVWLVGKLFRDAEEHNRHSLFFIPWAFWPILILAISGYTGWTAYSLDSAAKADPLGFAITSQTEYDEAIKRFKTERERLQAIYAQQEALPEAEKTAFEEDAKRLNRRGMELKQLSQQYAMPSAAEGR